MLQLTFVPQNPDLLTAQEHFVLQKINSLDETFFPMDLSISLDAMKSFAESESSAAGERPRFFLLRLCCYFSFLVAHDLTEKQQKRMDGFEGKLGKVSESVEQVMTDVKDMKGKMMTTEHFQSILELLERIQSASLDQRD